MLYKETLLLNIGKKGSHNMVVGGSGNAVMWVTAGWVPGAYGELNPTTLPSGQELATIMCVLPSSQTVVSYFGNKIDNITITRLDTNQSVTCPYFMYHEDEGNHQNYNQEKLLFTEDDIGKELWIDITIS